MSLLFALLAILFALTTETQQQPTHELEKNVPVYYINRDGNTPTVACNYLNFIGWNREYESFRYHFIEEGIQTNGSNLVEDSKTKNPKRNRSNSVNARYKGCGVKDYDRDEFPFNGLVEGGGWEGKKPAPSIRCIPASENRSDGAKFGNFIKATGSWATMDYYADVPVKRSGPIKPSTSDFPGDEFEIRVHASNIPDIEICLKLKPPPSKASVNKSKRKTDVNKSGWKTDVNKYGYIIERILNTADVDSLTDSFDKMHLPADEKKTIRRHKSLFNMTLDANQPKDVRELRRAKSNSNFRVMTIHDKKVDDLRWSQLIDPKLKLKTKQDKMRLRDLQLGLDKESILGAEQIRQFRHKQHRR
ncbi:hypothetical protein BJ684DRAFT_17518 [Piptocephalis cylindrospora]|uniref:Deoxyribonuclease NucA/NucB domain-containing protein n=1 Tax=Piptocephalis cylindrospora TaxID=1907219 RepID=A0A4P9XZU0_9FUNG|nr:hypothetical protein BJ684DRAFT_17518 [Piptocephalis cylindrospora]|eukprot:RKP11947.1 hypothetical protein BJ684DRAFT_17518 [Piptocephalis cylindrospora]